MKHLPWHSHCTHGVVVPRPALKYQNKLHAASGHKLHTGPSNHHPSIQIQQSSIITEGAIEVCKIPQNRTNNNNRKPKTENRKQNQRRDARVWGRWGANFPKRNRKNTKPHRMVNPKIRFYFLPKTENWERNIPETALCKSPKPKNRSILVHKPKIPMPPSITFKWKFQSWNTSLYHQLTWKKKVLNWTSAIGVQ